MTAACMTSHRQLAVRYDGNEAHESTGLCHHVSDNSPFQRRSSCYSIILVGAWPRFVWGYHRRPPRALRSGEAILMKSVASVSVFSRSVPSQGRLDARVHHHSCRMQVTLMWDKASQSPPKYMDYFVRLLRHSLHLFLLSATFDAYL